jgi:glycerol-3-phosphate acyltransferase PlsY
VAPRAARAARESTVIASGLHFLAGYVVGSIPVAVWAGRLIDAVDVRELGSRSAGATNVLRIFGWKPALAVALLDGAKGWVAASWLSQVPWPGGPVAPEWAAVAAGVGAVVGHLFPAFAGFRGGKGVATTAGVLLAWSPTAFLVCAGVFAAVAILSRRASVGSMSAALVMPATLFGLHASGADRVTLGTALSGAALALLIFLTHRENLRNLVRGTEPKLGERARRS